jgi:hypothetical protein
MQPNMEACAARFRDTLARLVDRGGSPSGGVGSRRACRARHGLAQGNVRVHLPGGGRVSAVRGRPRRALNEHQAAGGASSCSGDPSTLDALAAWISTVDGDVRRCAPRAPVRTRPPGSHRVRRYRFTERSGSVAAERAMEATPPGVRSFGTTASRCNEPSSTRPLLFRINSSGKSARLCARHWRVHHNGGPAVRPLHVAGLTPCALTRASSQPMMSTAA